MTKTNAQVGFKTRYRVQAIDRETGLPVGDEIRVENMVLRNGMLSLGDEVAYSKISIGTSDIPPSFDQTSLVTVACELSLDEGTFEQTIGPAQTSTDIISRISREYIFKEFRFPSNARTLTLREVGLSGVTRAVLPTALEINQNHWVRVLLEIDYAYRGSQTNEVPVSINTQAPTGVLKYTVTPFVYNQTPQNNTGRGYGGTNAVLGYVWNGTPEGITDRTFGTTLGLTVTREFDRDDCSVTFVVTGSFITQKEVPGFIIRDTVNGGGFKIQFPLGLVVEEDDAIELRFTYSWRQDPAAFV